MRATQYRFPGRAYVSAKDGRFLYVSADTGSAVIVNRAGSEVLEATREGGTPNEVARRLVGNDEVLMVAALRTMQPFLDEMVERGFLSNGNDLRGGSTHEEQSADADMRRELQVLYLHLTDGCNLRCVYCYNAAQRRNAMRRRAGDVERELSTGELLDLLDQAASLGARMIVFTGGEPLLRADACTLGKRARELGMEANLLTNGSLITPNLAQEIADAFDSVIVSIDSHVKSEHESLRPGAPFERVVDGIRHLAQAGVGSLALRPVISNTNLNSLPFFPAFAEKEFGCTTWSLANCIPNSPEDLELLDRFAEPGAFQEVVRKFRDALGERDGRFIKDEYTLEGAGSCGAAGAVLSVSATGDVYPCQNLHFSEYRAGNVRTLPLQQILCSSGALKAFRNASPPWFEECAECALSTVCASVCRVYHHTFQHSKSLFFRKMCPILRADLDAKLWREADRSGE